MQTEKRSVLRADLKEVMEEVSQVDCSRAMVFEIDRWGGGGGGSKEHVCYSADLFPALGTVYNVLGIMLSIGLHSGTSLYYFKDCHKN